MYIPTNNPFRIAKLLLAMLSCVLTFSTFQAASTTLTSDIDIFAAQPAVTPNKPNVLIVLDNSANWSRAAQQWPSANTQGESEVRAIKEVMEQLPLNSLNVGLFEYRTDGNAAANDSGYVRHHLRPLSLSNRNALVSKLETIGQNINEPIEKRSIGNPFGSLFQDVYNYLSELPPLRNSANQAGVLPGAGTPNLADPLGYKTPPALYEQFRSPLTSVDSCTRTIIIFIGNNRQGNLTTDSPSNKAALQAAGGDITQLPFAEFEVTTTPTTTSIPNSRTTCYATQSTCDSAASSLPVCTENGFTSCFCENALVCGTPERFRIWGDEVIDTPTASTLPTTTPGVYTGESTLSCIKPQDKPAYSCPSSTTTTNPDPAPANGTFDQTSTSWANCDYISTGAAGCNGNRENFEPRGDLTTQTTTINRTTTRVAVNPPVYSNSCYAENSNESCAATDFPATCTDGTYKNCACDDENDSISTGCTVSAASSYTLVGRSQIVSAEETGTFSAGATNVMSDEWARFMREIGVLLPGTGSDPVTNPEVRMRVSTYTIDVFNAQQSADFSSLLFSMARAGGGKYFQAKNEAQIKQALLTIFQEAQAVNSAFSSASLPVNATNRAQNENQVFIGVFKPDKDQEPRWFGNLKRFQLISSAGGVIELGDKDGEPAVNTQTGFLGDCAASFWTTDSGNYWGPVDSTDPPYALGACTTNSTNDFSDLPDGPFVEKGAAAEVLRKGSNDPSAAADGDGNYLVSRSMRTVTGSTAKGDNLPTFTAATLPNIDRDGDNDVDAADTALKASLFNFTRGEDTQDDDKDFSAVTPVVRALTEPRSTIHGDVIHSRPLPVNYGGATGVVIYYGANDGTFRAVDADTGVELWSFVAPEHYDRLQRLRANEPHLRFFGEPNTIGVDSTTGDPIPNPDTPKDYFFDGVSGIFQNGDNSKVWLYATMRRGGRMIYAFDVSDDPVDATDGPGAPKFLWRKGCPNASATEATTPACDAGFGEIGQTWSFPNVAFIEGYSDFEALGPSAKPVVVIGGGYNPCEDANQDQATPAACAAGQGSGVYVLDGEDGTLLKHFDFNGHSVAADVSLIDIDGDNNVDYGYAVDTAGSIYRLNFIGCASPPCDQNEWTSAKVAASTSGGRIFLFGPALFQASTNVVYVALGSGDREAPLMNMYPCGGDANEDGVCDGAITNRFYVLKDYLNASATVNLDDTTGTVMEDYTLENPPGCNPDGTGTPTDATLKCPNDRGVLPNDLERGWYMNVRDSGFPGEQTVTSAVITGGLLIFSTNRPTPVNVEACSTSLGEARGYIINLFNGSGAIGVEGAEGGDRSSTFVGGGLPPSPVTAVVPIDGVLRPIVIGAVKKDGSEGSSVIGAQEIRPPIKSYRTPVYWFKTGDTDTSDD